MRSHEIAHRIEEIFSHPDLVDAIKTINGSGEDILAALSELTAILQRAPNAELEHLLIGRRGGDVAGNLKSLVTLSKYDKKRWLALIEEFGLPIELNVKASSRDIVGKVLAYIDAHPEALQTAKKTKQKPDYTTLEDTLNKLINFR